SRAGPGTRCSLTRTAPGPQRPAQPARTPSEPPRSRYSDSVAVDGKVHVVLGRARPRTAPAPADRGKRGAHGRSDHPRPVPRALHVRDRRLVARHPAADVGVLAWVEVDGIPEGVIRPVMRGHAATAGRRARVTALEGSGHVAALPGVRPVDGRE